MSQGADLTDHCTLPPGSIVGNYTIHSVLGQGGFGVTYLAEHRQLKRKTALKECLPSDLARRDMDLSIVPHSESVRESFEWAVKSFLREAQILANLEHPNIMVVHDVFEANGTGYMASKLIDGCSVYEWATRGGGRLSAVDLELLLHPLLNALEWVHGQGIIHRDLKPSNILITANGDPILIDFGSARLRVSGQTCLMTTVVTPGYAPLEQYDNSSKQGPFTDLYALAASFHHLLRGAAPQEASVRVLDDSYESLAEDPAFEDYPNSVLKALDASLEPMPANRPQSVADFRALMSDLLDVGVAKTELHPKRLEIQPESDFDALASEPTEIYKGGPQEGRSGNSYDAALPAFEKRSNSPSKAVIVGAVVSLLIILTVAFTLKNDASKPDLALVESSSNEGIPALAAPKGSLRIQALPEVEVAAISEAGERTMLGQTDDAGLLLAADTVDAGVYTLEFRKPYYELRSVDAVIVSPDETFEAIVEMQPLPTELSVTVEPANVAWDFYVDGSKQLGGPRWTFQPDQTYSLQVQARGYETVEREITLSTGQQLSWDVVLEKRTGPEYGKEWVALLGDGVSLRLQPIRSGTFLMGSPVGELGRDQDEKQHEVRLSQGFWLGKYEVTQEQWDSIMDSNPSYFDAQDGRVPVEAVTWERAMEFCRKLTDFEISSGRLPGGFRYTLPTEAQWEYAARAGSKGRFNFGNNERELYRAAWFSRNSMSKTHRVGEKLPNAWGLHDMHGNVWEWCLDWYEEYPEGSVTDPTGPNTGAYRVLRGGGWFDSAETCRSAFRRGYLPDLAGNLMGFRVALVKDARRLAKKK